MEAKWVVTTRIIEQGNIYFFYKPKKNVMVPKGLVDISLFYIVLEPDNADRRFIVIGKKRMPHSLDGGETMWGFIEKIGGRGYRTQKDSQLLPKAARPVGEGIYSIVTHGDHTHFLYMLELPQHLGEAQQAFSIQKQGSYILLVKHPLITEASFSEGVPRTKGRFVAAAPRDLRTEGAELLLIGDSKNVQKVGVQGFINEENEFTADIFNTLKLSRDRHLTKPLLQGEWQ